LHFFINRLTIRKYNKLQVKNDSVTIGENMQPYFAFIEHEIKFFYDSLSERDKRLYTAIEAMKIGYGGISYISKVVNCSRATIKRGKRELLDLQAIPKELVKRIRKPGGGRKPYHETFEKINEQFLDVLKHYTAGDPMNEEIIWTNLLPAEIIALLKKIQCQYK